MPRLGSDERFVLRAFAYDGINETRSHQSVTSDLPLSAGWAALSHLTTLGYVASVDGGYALTVKGIEELNRMKGWRLDARTATEQP